MLCGDFDAVPSLTGPAIDNNEMIRARYRIHAVGETPVAIAANGLLQFARSYAARSGAAGAAPMTLSRPLNRPSPSGCGDVTT